MSGDATPHVGRTALPGRPGLRSDYCVFRRGGAEFAVSTLAAREVLHTRPFTPVPQAPGELIGAFNLRGEVIPLVNLDRFLGVVGRAPDRNDTWLLFGGNDLSFAALIDTVVDIKHIPPWEIDRLTPEERTRQALVRGRMSRNQQNIVILDGDRLVAAVVGEIAAAFRRQSRGTAPLQVPHSSSGGSTHEPSGSAQGGASHSERSRVQSRSPSEARPSDSEQGERVPDGSAGGKRGTASPSSMDAERPRAEGGGSHGLCPREEGDSVPVSK